MNKFFSPQDKVSLKSKFGKWSVSKSGDMLHDSGYPIYDHQLERDNWIIHMLEKDWVDFNDFIPAYFQALKNAGIKNKKVQVFY